jgi:enoyl-CoA hydratase/carnithine racemase
VIEIQVVGTVQVLALSSGRVNALDVELLEELTDVLRELQHSGADALVVTGAGRVFSAGVDVNRVVEGGVGYTDRLIPALSGCGGGIRPWRHPGRRLPPYESPVASPDCGADPRGRRY